MMTLSEASRAVAGNVIGADIRFTSVSTDSRTLESGALFVALRGDRFDGHEYLGAACERGAAAALVERAAVDAGRTAGMPLLAADDTRYALGALAQYFKVGVRLMAAGPDEITVRIERQSSGLMGGAIGATRTTKNMTSLRSELEATFGAAGVLRSVNEV